ncbi:MAG: hypothetical protein JRG73_03560 [Deltaproteobacteria bacterium]|nr:hypothetical protein [Deltaproteobacteria bacterium]
MKPIRLSGHARENMQHRGAMEYEIIDTIRSAAWGQIEGECFECRKDFAYGQDWNDKYYATKRVRSIFVEEAEEIVVMTVYVYYFC